VWERERKVQQCLQPECHDVKPIHCSDVGEGGRRGNSLKQHWRCAQGITSKGTRAEPCGCSSWGEGTDRLQQHHLACADALPGKAGGKLSGAKRRPGGGHPVLNPFSCKSNVPSAKHISRIFVCLLSGTYCHTFVQAMHSLCTLMCQKILWQDEPQARCQCQACLLGRERMWYSATATGVLSPLQASKEAISSFPSQCGWKQIARREACQSNAGRAKGACGTASL